MACLILIVLKEVSLQNAIIEVLELTELYLIEGTFNEFSMEILDRKLSTYEKDVYAVISRALSENETLQFDRIFDFKAPNGIKKLQWPNDTAIEVKYRLIYSSLSAIKYNFEHTSLKKLVVVVFENGNVPRMIQNHNVDYGRDVEVLSYDELIKKINISSKNNKNKILFDIDNEYTNKQNSTIHQKAENALKNDKISLFLGAGVSASAGVVTWNSLLEQLCVKNDISKLDSDIDSVIKARYVIDEYKRLHVNDIDKFNADMREILYENTHPSQLISSISKLILNCSIESVITYNYDDLIEQNVNINGTKCYSVYNKSRPINGDCLPIYHVHGFIPKDGACSEIVLGEKEYHKIYQESYNWGNVEQLHALCRSTCFFIGLSMMDPNLRRLIDISIDGSEIEPVHYAFLRRIEYDVPFMEKIMRGFGINCIWYNNFEDLPNLIYQLIE